MIALTAGAPCVIKGDLHLQSTLFFRFHGKAFAATRVVDWVEAHVGPSGLSIAARTPGYDVVGEARPGELAVVPKARRVLDDHVVVDSGRVKEVTAAGEVRVESNLPPHVEGRRAAQASFACDAVTLKQGAVPTASKVRGLRPGVTALLRSTPGGAVVARIQVPPERKPGAGQGAGVGDVVWGNTLEERAGAVRLAIRGGESTLEGWVDGASLVPAVPSSAAQAAALAAQADSMQLMMLASLGGEPRRAPPCQRPVPIYVRDGGPATLVGTFRAGAVIEAQAPTSTGEVPVSLGASELVPFVRADDLARCAQASTDAPLALVPGRGLVLGALPPAAPPPGPVGLAVLGGGQPIPPGTASPGPGGNPNETKVSGPKGDAVLGAHSESTPVANAARVLAGLRPRFRQCYQQGLATDPTMKGNVVLTIRVAPNGDVSTADVAKNTGLSPTVAACLVSAAKRAAFDPPGAAGATLSVPFTLSPVP